MFPYDLLPTYSELRANLWNDLIVWLVPPVASWLFKLYRNVFSFSQLIAVLLAEFVLAPIGWKLISQQGSVAVVPALALCLLPVVLLYFVTTRKHYTAAASGQSGNQEVKAPPKEPRPSTAARSTRRREPGAGARRRNEIDGTVLVYVPGGEYILGSIYISRQEEPVHSVRLSPYWIGKYPVTNEQYKRFLDANQGTPLPARWYDWWPKEPQRPVDGVSWHEAQAYCRWAGLSLPSEAQWEAAARGKDQRRYPWGDAFPTEKHAELFGDGAGSPHRVGSYPRGAGPFGTLDQVGNVSEWCLDVFELFPYDTREGAQDPVSISDQNDERCIRGGWTYVGNIEYPVEAAYRKYLRAIDQGAGFRCVAPV